MKLSVGRVTDMSGLGFNSLLSAKCFVEGWCFTARRVALITTGSAVGGGICLPVSVVGCLMPKAYLGRYMSYRFSRGVNSSVVHVLCEHEPTS